MGQNLKFDLEKNSIVCGDCCNEEGEGWLNFIPDNSVDLIYIDPPFFSNKNYEIIWGNGFEVRSFGDRFKGGIGHYIRWMKPKIREAKRILKNTGSIFLHCDWHANHRLRYLLDEVFGEKNFKNEIIWYYYNKYSAGKNYFPRASETIMFYSKDKKGYFKPLREQREKATKQLVRENINGVLKNKKNKDGKCIYRIVTDKKMDNVWRIPCLQPASKEMIGYKTQKPKALLERIINCASKENDLILDFFSGGGTTAEVCADLNRRFIIGDVSPVAVRVTADRLSAHGYRNYEIKALPSTKKDYLDMNPHKFADMICELMGWKPNIKKSGDGGIDGFADKGNIPIQIKNHKNNTGRPDIQKFVGALNKYKTGFFVAWSFSPGAWEFKANVKDKKIEFIEIGKEILNGLLISDDKSIEHKKLYKEKVKKSFKEAAKVTESELQKEKQEIQKEKREEVQKSRKSRSNNS